MVIVIGYKSKDQDQMIGFNIEQTRIPLTDECKLDHVQKQQHSGGAVQGAFGAASLIGKEIATYKPEGRWPANVVLCGNLEALFPWSKSGSPGNATRNVDLGYSGGWGVGSKLTGFGDSGSATRFFKRID